MFSSRIHPSLYFPPIRPMQWFLQNWPDPSRMERTTQPMHWVPKLKSWTTYQETMYRLRLKHVKHGYKGKKFWWNPKNWKFVSRTNCIILQRKKKIIKRRTERLHIHSYFAQSPPSNRLLPYVCSADRPAECSPGLGWNPTELVLFIGFP